LELLRHLLWLDCFADGREVLQESPMHSHIRRLLCALMVAAPMAATCAARIDVSPEFPSYGAEVLVQLSDAGQAPYIPATRYRLAGNNIVVELEHNSGGYFGWRRDVGVVALPLGELVPGTYTVQAKLYDIFYPGAAPLLFTRSIDVAAPDAPGAYAVPRNPGAYDAIDIVVRADGAIAPGTMRTSMSGTTIRVDFDYAATPSPSFSSVALPGLAPGSYRLEVYGRNPQVMATSLKHVANFNVGTASTVVEYYAEKLDHYLITAWPDEIAGLDAGDAFKRTGERFRAWLRAVDAPAYAVPVCRFYASGPNSHFYTADPGECQFLKSLEQNQRADASAKGQAFPGWQFEAIAFYVVAPESGTCPANTQPVYRAYNARAAENDSNHRFMVREVIRDAMLAGWHDEGLAFCAPL
jgi:hypothetical protein